MSTRNFVPRWRKALGCAASTSQGDTGWAFVSSTLAPDIAWQLDDITFAYLKVNDGTDATGALALANSLTFIDWNS